MEGTAQPSTTACCPPQQGATKMPPAYMLGQARYVFSCSLPPSALVLTHFALPVLSTLFSSPNSPLPPSHKVISDSALYPKQSPSVSTPVLTPSLPPSYVVVFWQQILFSKYVSRCQV